MSDATWQDVAPERTAQDIPLPAPVLIATPVLIGDCATPLAGETVLSLLWKRLSGDHTE